LGTPVGCSFAKSVLEVDQALTGKRDVLVVFDLVPVAWLESSWQVNGLSINTEKGAF
jgi:hypothetical protein